MEAEGTRIFDGVKFQLRQTEQAPTSYTDVMTEVKDGRRTFFHARGANASSWGKLRSSILT